MENKYNIKKEHLQRLREDGWKTQELADLYGCDRRWIGNRIKKWGLQIQPQRVKIDEDELRECFEEGMTQPEMAKYFGCSRSVIYYRLKDLGLKRRKGIRTGRYVGSRSFVWKGGVRIKDGYIRIRRYDREEVLHRLIAQDVMGYDLSDDDHVHHMDGNRANNAPENLMVCTNTEHMKLHAAMRRDPDLDQRQWLADYREQQQKAA